MRALAYGVGVSTTSIRSNPDAEVRREGARLRLADDADHQGAPPPHTTPIPGFENANRCLQAWGGHGYIAEWGMEQFVRRCADRPNSTRAPNGIQALDLVGRKLPEGTGRCCAGSSIPSTTYIREKMDDARLQEFVLAAGEGVRQAAAATGHDRAEEPQGQDEAGAASSDYLRLFALVALAYLWARMAGDRPGLGAAGETAGPAFYRAKLKNRAITPSPACCRRRTDCSSP